MTTVADLSLVRFPSNLQMPPPVVTTRWMNAAEAAEYLGVSGNKLREMRAAFRAAHGAGVERRIGRRAVRFAAVDLERLGDWWSRRIEGNEEA